MFTKTLLHIPRTIAERSKEDDCWECKIGPSKIKVWTEPSPEENRVYINVYAETASGFHRVKAVTGVILVPLTIGEIINLHVKDHNLFMDMNDFDFERLTYESIEFSPMFLWPADGSFLIFVPGMHQRVEEEPLTLEQKVAFDIQREMWDDFRDDSEE